MATTTPSYLRRGRWVLGGLAAVLVSLLILIAAKSSGIPWGIDFSKSADGPDRFSASLRTIVWWSLLLELLLVAILWRSLPRWLGSSVEAPDSGTPRKDAGYRVPLLSAVLAIATLAMIDAPRLSESLWNDELWSLRESIHGSWDRELKSAEPEDVLMEIYWEPIGWELAVWRYETTNHHFLLNLMAKTGLGAWQRITGAEDWEFDEVALRILPFLCALAALAAWPVFFYSLGYRGAAILLPWLLALQPWYQQHATGMRGYPLVFLLLPLTLLSALAALRRGGWSAWMAYAATQFLFLYSWPAGAIVMVGFNLCLAIATWRRWLPVPGAPGDQLKRWAIANLATLMPLLPLVLPGIFQIGPYLQEEVLRHPMGLPWLRNLASFFFTGAPWPDVDGYSQRNGFHTTGEMLLRSRPILFPALALAALAALLGGLITMIRRDRLLACLFLAGLTLGPAASYLKATVGTAGEDVFIFQWYFIYALPFLYGIAAIGISTLSQRLSGTGIGSRLAPAVVGGSFILCYAVLVYPRTVALRSGSMDPRRESVHAMRGGLHLTDPANAKILSAHIFRSALAYDPLGWSVKTASNDGLPAGSDPGLTQLMRIADTRDLSLFVNVGLPQEARERHAEAMEIIDNSGFFVLEAQLFGLEPQFERAVYRYRGGLFKFDFSRPKP